MEIFVAALVAILFILYVMLKGKSEKTSYSAKSSGSGRTDEEKKDIRKRGYFVPDDSAFQPVELSFKFISRADEIVEVPSTSAAIDFDKKYIVNLRETTCTCADFGYRKDLPRDSSKRLCRHLLREAVKRSEIEVRGKWEHAIINNGGGVPLKAWLVSLSTAPDMMITLEGSDEWVNVLAHSKRSGERISESSGEIERHGWNFREHRWSYGAGPSGARELTRLLKSVTERELP